MSRKHETEVLVVGAGPVGLFTALCLAYRGVRVQIIDEEFRTSAHSYALVLHPRSLELLEDLGIATDILRQGYRVETAAFYRGQERAGEMRFAECGGKFPYALAVPQSLLESLLEDQLRLMGIKVQWNHRATALSMADTHVAATIDKLTRGSCGYAVATTEWVAEKTMHSEAAFVVGADGHRSIVRKSLGIEYEAASDSESFAVFEFQADADLEYEVRIVFDGNTSNVLWPLPFGRFRWSFQLEHPGSKVEPRSKRRLTVPIGRQVFPHLTRDDLTAFIQARAPWFDWDVQQLDWAMEVRFDRRLARQFGRNRCWLAGDSAHLTGPIGGQSLNMGLREACDLAVTLSAILRDGAPLDSLDGYSERYSGEWRKLLGLGGGLTPSDQAQTWAKDCRTRILPCIPATGDDLANLAMQIGLTSV
ncbi:MAG: FAD-dependent monooxygenase [Phycisphaerales bacterium]|nr:MAG: FAD-dependent monooxygenase [Phycisphaerales bacterium]